MNRFYMKLSVLVCLCVIGLLTSSAGGRKVTVYLRDGFAMIGELISVRADGISISTLHQGVSDEMLLLLLRYLTDIPPSNIQRVTSEGQSHIVAGTLIGTGVGVAAGAAIAAADSQLGHLWVPQRQAVTWRCIRSTSRNWPNYPSPPVFRTKGGRVTGSQLSPRNSVSPRMIRGIFPQSSPVRLHLWVIFTTTTALSRSTRMHSPSARRATFVSF